MTADIEELSAKTDVEPYTFEVEELPVDKIKNVATDRLLAALSRVCIDIARGVGKRPYDEVKGQFKALNVELNVRGEIAPRFRPYLSSGPPKIQFRSPENDLISNDLQVLDLHWLWCRKAFDHDRLQNVPPRWQSLFGREFDPVAAAYFARTAGDMNKKAMEILHLKQSEQVELRMLQSSQTRDWWGRVKKQRTDVSSLMQTAAIQSNKLQGKESQHEQVWLAYECKSRAGGRVPDWVELISGKTIPGTSISTMKKRVERLKRTSKYKAKSDTKPADS